MIEAAFVFNEDGNVIHWHLPPGRSGGSIPDSRDLWEVLWESRHNLGGVAHTHPWNGAAWYSGTDVTTFAACEGALGKRLVWPVITFSQVVSFKWAGPEKHNYKEVEFTLLKDEDINKLRELSTKITVTNVNSQGG